MKLTISIPKAQTANSLASTIEKARAQNVHTVAQDGTAEHTSIGSAIRKCQPNDTVRILDDEHYTEKVWIAGADQQGVTVEFLGKARWKPQSDQTGPNLLCLVITQPDVTIRGAHFLVEPTGCGAVMGQDASGCRFEQCTFENGSTGISVELLTPAYDRSPATVRESSFIGLQVGIRVSGSSNDNLIARPSSDILICDNSFVNCSHSTAIFGEVHNVMFAGNIVSGSTMGGIQCQNLLPGSDNILVANNSFLKCRNPIRVWENGVPDVIAQFVNNLTLQSNVVDWQVWNSGGSPTILVGPGDGKAFTAKWVLRNNFREGGQRSDIDWIPPSASDHLVSEIEVLSRDSEHPDYLRPGTDSPLATGGAGRELPSYVGAITPTGTARFDWEKYFTTVFKSETKATE